MKLNEIIFIDNLPSLDLHGIDSATAKVLINDFIRDNKIMKNKNVIIIHGIGTGIIKNTTQEVLKYNKDVKDFKIYPYNAGCTIVEIK